MKTINLSRCDFTYEFLFELLLKKLDAPIKDIQHITEVDMTVTDAEFSISENEQSPNSDFENMKIKKVRP